jgi:hypothetical protein
MRKNPRHHLLLFLLILLIPLDHKAQTIDHFFLLFGLGQIEEVQLFCHFYFGGQFLKGVGLLVAVAGVTANG